MKAHACKRMPGLMAETDVISPISVNPANIGTVYELLGNNVKAPDPAVADLLYDLGNLAALEVTPITARGIFKTSLTHQRMQTAEVKSKLNYYSALSLLGAIFSRTLGAILLWSAAAGLVLFTICASSGARIPSTGHEIMRNAFLFPKKGLIYRISP